MKQKKKKKESENKLNPYTSNHIHIAEDTSFIRDTKKLTGFRVPDNKIRSAHDLTRLISLDTQPGNIFFLDQGHVPFTLFLFISNLIRADQIRLEKIRSDQIMLIFKNSL